MSDFTEDSNKLTTITAGLAFAVAATGVLLTQAQPDADQLSLAPIPGPETTVPVSEYPSVTTPPESPPPAPIAPPQTPPTTVATTTTHHSHPRRVRASRQHVRAQQTSVPSPSDPRGNREMGREMLLATGMGDDQWACLEALWTRESNWDENSINKKSGAGGIPQALPPKKMGDGWEGNALHQIRWGLEYIRSRYGTPCRADSFQRRNGWY